MSQWLAAARRGGRDAVLSRLSHCGITPKLTPEQLRLIRDVLGQGAEAYGFRGEVGTGERVAGVLDEAFGVSSRKSQGSRLLKRRGWTPQVPIPRAIPRDEAAIERGRTESWPALREEARRERRALGFLDESGFSPRPGVVKTEAPKGRTPVVDEGQTRDQRSVLGGVTAEAKVYSLVRSTPLNGWPRLEFPVPLGGLVGDRLGVIGDGSPIPRRVEVKAIVAEAAGKIHWEPLPPEAPDRNPVEGLGKHLKEVELRNRICLDREQRPRELHLALGRVRQRRTLVHSFFEGAELEL